MIKINFVGDISLNNGYQQLAQVGENPFRQIEPLLTDADLNIGNLECLCSLEGQENYLKVPRLKTSPEAYTLLQPLHLTMASLAHNHIYDVCQSGIQCTLDRLKELGIQAIGYQPDPQADPYVWQTTLKGMPLTLVTAVHPDTNPHLPDDVHLNLPFYDKEKIVTAIRQAKQEDHFVAVYLHWGGMTEEGFMPDWYEIEDAHRFIDAGADIVVGSHSHTVQPHEVYKGKHIFYSLGNFCFDDVVTDGKTYPIGRYRKRKGLMVSLEVNEQSHRYTVKTQRLRNADKCIEREPAQLKLRLRNLRFALLSKVKPLWKFNFTWFRKVSPIFIYMVESPDTMKTKLSKFKLNKLTQRLKSK